jgi:3-hydroxyisobutyrate dehydrogenase-like beta-hydroxyacid dehydrogenase
MRLGNQHADWQPRAARQRHRLNSRICLIGFGEVGQVLAADLRASGGNELTAWDLQFGDPASVPSRGIKDSGVRAASSAADALAEATLVICAVTATECIGAATTAAVSIAPGAVFLDLNSVSPMTKTKAAAAITAFGGHYVEAAVMSPIAPARIAAPMLFGGPHARAFLPQARALGFGGASVFSDVIGRASAAKMCRSVIVKGIEALLTESLLAARRYGVEQAVLESLSDTLPVGDWRSLSRYMIARSLQHGRRRAAEMREVAITVREAGVDPWMSSACAERQDWAALRRDASAQVSLSAMLDAILAACSS